MSVPPAAVEAAYQVMLNDGWILPYGASVRDYPDLADLKAADLAAEQANREALARVLAAAERAFRKAHADEIGQLADDPVFRDNITSQWENHADSGTAFLRGMKQAVFSLRVGRSDTTGGEE